MSETTLQERAATLLALHQPGNPVVLPTVWDAWSARLAVGEQGDRLLRSEHVRQVPQVGGRDELLG